VDGGANWFATGDMAVVDDKGFVNVVSRLKDMIIRWAMALLSFFTL
jgi:acyl-CoA synthetase (AMP-forming)/AMP-acid ligase II